MSDTIDVNIYTKFDYELSNNEIQQIFIIYNECFYDSKCNQTKLVKEIKRLLSKCKTWQWYLAKVNGKIIGMAAYCYSYQNATLFSVNPNKGENILNVAVLPKYRRIGIANLLMNTIINEHGSLIDLTVEVKINSPFKRILIEFYQGLGFDEIPLKPDEPEDPDNIYLRLNKSIVKI